MLLALKTDVATLHSDNCNAADSQDPLVGGQRLSAADDCNRYSLIFYGFDRLIKA
jgi:hypothetical protein